MPPVAYFDTSVLLKRYVQEAGSARAQDLLRRYRVLTSAVATVEATSALVRRRAAGEIAAADFAAIVRQLARDRQRWNLVEATLDVLDRAEAVIVEVGARTLDAIHLASALAVQATSAGRDRRLPFITGDGRQRTAAQRLGLQVTWVD